MPGPVIQSVTQKKCDIFLAVLTHVAALHCTAAFILNTQCEHFTPRMACHPSQQTLPKTLPNRVKTTVCMKCGVYLAFNFLLV